MTISASLVGPNNSTLAAGLKPMPGIRRNNIMPF